MIFQSYKDILKITTLFSGVQGLNILLNVVRTKLAALILGPAGIGLNSIYNEMRELLHTTTNLGMDVSGVREVSLAYETGDSAKIKDAVLLTRSWILLLSFFGALTCFLLSEPLSWITFSDFNHTWNYVLLSPAVALSTLTCGEMAILKGMRRLKDLAIISVLDIFAGIITTIPIYYIWGLKGIVPAILILTLVLYIIVIFFSYNRYPIRFNFRKKHLSKGFKMFMIGISFVLAGIVSHGTEIVIRSYLNSVASLKTVGLYSACFTIVMTYGGLVFASLDNDYFPRLSGYISDIQKCKEAVNKQIEVLLMLIVPLTILLILVLPFAVPLLFSSKFNDAIPMAQIASLGLLFRAVYLPVGYIPLAAGDSKSFLGLECLSYIIVLFSVITGFHFYSLLGAGIALAVCNFIDMIVTVAYVRFKYKISVTDKIVFFTLTSSLLICTVLVFCQNVQ